jgi:hypothetical protein
LELCQTSWVKHEDNEAKKGKERESSLKIERTYGGVE